MGSSDGYTDGEDFDRTHQMDHLAQLGTSPPVSTLLITFLISVIATYFTAGLKSHSDAASALIYFTCETVKLNNCGPFQWNGRI